ncbi:MAG: type I-MYXAN CRISPR-associated protein Cas6/Cmx6 [Gammaproteobacteria bacterium]|nr:type I-MYXAN CRISPR-associated protein Cas6/Cmx6 [Gammaproteobacteria bacterium]
MLWQEDDEDDFNFDNGEVIDIIYRLEGKTLPNDYSFALFNSILTHAPWLQENPQVGIHLVIAGEEGNGWMREDDPSQVMYLSRRTRLLLRIPTALTDEAESLVNKTLAVAEHQLQIKSCEQQPLSQLTTLYARHVASSEAEENAFLENIVAELTRMNVRCKKLMCGKTRSIATAEETLQTRSLMLADLKPEDAIKIQQHGLGPHRGLGCGLFVPHKSIKRV